MIYEFQCSTCNSINEVRRLMKDRNDPCQCEWCGGDTERIPSLPYVTPESLLVEGNTPATRGRRVLLNDCDDPWEGVDGLSAEQSEEVMAKRDETLGLSSSSFIDNPKMTMDMGANT
jgi:putative FmdB family regulatory protein